MITEWSVLWVFEGSRFAQERRVYKTGRGREQDRDNPFLSYIRYWDRSTKHSDEGEASSIIMANEYRTIR